MAARRSQNRNGRVHDVDMDRRTKGHGEMKRIRNGLGNKQTELKAVVVFLLLSMIVALSGFRYYQNYRHQAISMEESQLLTIAGIVGDNLDSYLEQKIHQIDLIYRSEGMPEDWARIDGLTERMDFFLKENGNLYNWVTVTAPDGSVTRYAPGQSMMVTKIGRGKATDQTDGRTDEAQPARASDASANVIEQSGHPTAGGSIGTPAVDSKSAEGSEANADNEHPARITGKKISPVTGWYEMYIGKEIDTKEGVYQLCFAMNLEALYKNSVAKVKIGKNGYSVVKDQNLYIIMHHAKDQIGLDALYDRERLYPELNYSSMHAWLEKQANEDSGTGVIDTYDWADETRPRVQRVVAFRAIYIQGERWIVNSTIPVTELSAPLDDMMMTMIGIVFVYIMLLGIIVVFVLQSHFQAAATEKEITYLKEINRGMEAVARKNEEIRHYQRIQSLGMMSSHIAHEFNNYLTPVMIYAELLENDESISAENKEMIHEMLVSVDRASDLSKQLLAFARQDTGVRLERLNFTEEVRHATGIVEQLAPSAITVHIDITEESLYILGRKGMAEHILMNLCKNAFQAMEKTERKELGIELTTEAAVASADSAGSPAGSGNAAADLASVNGDTKASAAGRRLVLRVRDTGCGISEDAQQKIFEPFYTTKGSRHGTGLGLSVVRNILSSIGGTIRVESMLGEGTCFSMEIPLCEEEDGEENVRPASNHGDAEGRRGIDGNTGIPVRQPSATGSEYSPKGQKAISKIAFVVREEQQKTWRLLVRSSEKAIDFYDHPAALIDRIQKDPAAYDMIITAYQLPTMNGIELCEIIRRLSPGVRLVLVAKQGGADYEWYLNNGMIDRFILTSDFEKEFLTL